ncbi:MAG: FMN-binding protein [Solobacterium sp.]|nr:FMN-binding protein [Solobacterium sp.]MBR2769824.1 FMN-binding protein [Solobacterium sp.]MBR2793653.1 FMN-binding protein [Solobacterium sp.]
MNREGTLYKAVLLGVLCAVCGLLLGGVNALTEPIITEAAIANEKANLELIYPGASFAAQDFTDDSGYVQGVYSAEGKGMIYKIHATGYNSEGFTFLLAFNDDGSVGGFKVLEENETGGFGKRCFEDPYVSEVNALTSNDSAPLLSGATLTSTAIQKGFAAASALFNSRK